MKKLSPSIVRVEKIAYSQPRTAFSETELDEAAQLILEIEGVVTPPVLLRTGTESYTLIDGEFEYYAALRAMEIDSRRGKRINAYLVESEDEKAVYQKQIEVFRQRKSMPPPTPDLPPTQSPALTEAVDEKEDRLVSLEKTVSQLVAKHEALEKTVTTLTDAVATLTTLISDKMTNIGDQIRQEVAKEQTPPDKPPIPSVQSAEPLIFAPKPSEIKPVQPTVASISDEKKFIEDVNTLSIQDMTLKFDRFAGVRQKSKVIDLIERERQKQDFLSIKDMIKRAKGTGLLGKITISNIFSQWF